MKLLAYAKINIGLHILGKRPDGFHNLETVFHEIDLFDEIILEHAARLILDADSSLVPIDDSNLCLRAAFLLQKEKETKQGAKISLKKNIPVGAGLGGGSSNAATVLRGLNILWNLNLSIDTLKNLAAQLGSDVPFFIEGGSAYATGRGEIVKPLRLEIPYWIALVTPPIHVSTAQAYGHLHLHRDGMTTRFHDVLAKNMKDPKALQKELENDFESSVFEAYPDIRNAKRLLLSAGSVFSMMSGSGSSVFGFFLNEREARDALASFPKGYQTALTAPGFQPHHQPITE